MSRRYVHCIRCRTRMKLTGTSGGKVGCPPQDVFRHYECPACDATLTWDIFSNTFDEFHESRFMDEDDAQQP